MLLGFEIGQRWPEAVMHSCGSYSVPVPKHAGVSVVSLQAILKALWKKKIMTKEEVGQLLAKIKDTDNLALSGAVEREIFAEANSGEKDGC
jgi:hypothetical protein